MLNVAMDQIAFCSRSDEDEASIKKILQLDDMKWIEDTVTAFGQVGDKNGVSNTAKLLFNYDLDHEVEILRYTSGLNYLDQLGIPSGHICHIGMHVLTGMDVQRIDAPVIQQVVTQTHTNPFVLRNNRHYRYTIYNTQARLGVLLKVIERIDG